MPNRLFVDEIVSVGAVAEGDNPESEIVFWKAHPEVEKQTQSERAAQILEGLIERERQLRAVKRGVPVEQISRAKVLDFLVRDEHSAAAKAFAALLASRDEGDVELLKRLDTEKVYRRELAKFRAEKAHLQKETPMSDDDTTLHDEVVEKVRLFARRRNYDLYGRVRGTTPEKVAAEFWATPEGGKVAALLRDPIAREPAAIAKTRIAKSRDHADLAEALRIVEGLDR